MSTSEPNTFETRHGGPGPAPGAPVGASGESQSRRQEIMRADPYYPHTAMRAITMWFALALFCLGFAALATLLLPNREFGWYYVSMVAVIATTFVGGQVLLRGFRVGRLEQWGRIARR